MPIAPTKERSGTGLIDVLDHVLDKGLVINADILVSVCGVELLGIKIRAVLASIETAAKYGLEFPLGTNRSLAAWEDAQTPKETCPECGKRAALTELLDHSCPWCGWQSPRSTERKSFPERIESEPWAVPQPQLV
ncbi:MAG: gas vesicle protein [Armatimonadetes bacterium CG_4_9_14_3_um_filter_66_14]|nr:MAG: gas vesicle protein [Armatimonadetes bacterium CG_4_10_14_3_um_filter_59_10]PJB62402.1 MAG: gas vesicle protein [Armatimonadetes bacterium CG_4_9_14_3_um_filter_66_14]